MITFTVSFLVSFPLSEKGLKLATEKPRRGSMDKKARSKSTSAMKLETKSMEYLEQCIELNSANFAHAARIKYEIIPNKCKYDLDIICWGPVAKLIGSDNSLIVLTIIQDDVIWVPATIVHYLDEISVPELKSFHQKIINFTVTNIASSATGILKNEKIFIPESKLICENNFIRHNTFEILPDIIPDRSPRSSIEPVLTKTKSRIPKPVLGHLISDENFDKFHDIIESLSNGAEIRLNEYIPSSLRTNKHEDAETKPTTSTAKLLNGKKNPKLSSKELKGSKGKREDDESLVVKVCAEIFFTKPALSIFRGSSNGDFATNFFVILSVDKLLTRTQKLLLNPLVINIIKIQNLPVQKLRENGFHSIYASYNIPHVLHSKTNPKPIAKSIHFNEAHMHFTDDVQKIKVVEALQTQKFYVEIYGIRPLPEPKDIVNACLFGKKKKDFNLSVIKPSFENYIEYPPESPVLLAVSLFDLSSLVDNIWIFKEIGQIHEPHLTLTSKPKYDMLKHISEAETVNQINLESYQPPNIIPECTFLEFGTSLKLEAYLLAPQAACLAYHHVPNTFKRIFIIAEEDNFARMLYNNIATNNKNVLEDIQDKNVPNQNLELYDVLTGFILDNGNNHFFYMEGPSTGFILNMWHIIEGACPGASRASTPEGSETEIEEIPVRKGRIFFNTDTAFEKRLYLNFITKGLYEITLKIPLQDILANPLLYTRKNVPTPCMEALKKLCLLFHSVNYKDILQQNLLPSTHELISLNLEWGVPHRWKDLYTY